MQVKENSLAYQTKKKNYTYRDYLELPDDGNRYEILEEELVMSPSPKKVHQRLVRKIVIELNHFVEEQNLGEVFISPFDVVFDEKNIVQPDIFYLAREHEKIATDDNVQGAPDLIVEILSPASAYYDLIEKKEMYEKFGVQEYWIVDPKKHRIEIFTLENGKYGLSQRVEKKGQIQSKILKGLEIRLATIFALEEK